LRLRRRRQPFREGFSGIARRRQIETDDLVGIRVDEDDETRRRVVRRDLGRAFVKDVRFEPAEEAQFLRRRRKHCAGKKEQDGCQDGKRESSR
jgi:hypothetical protein